MSIGTSVEQAPRSAAAEEIFLTPRVLDRRAFEDYSESLKRLIKDASGEGQTLSRTAADVRALRDQLASVSQDAQKRLEAATRLLASVEMRLEPVAGARADGRTVPRTSEAVLKAVGLNGKAAVRTRSAIDAEAAPLAPAAVAPTADALRAIEASILARLESQIETRVEARVAAVVASRVEALVEAGVQDRLGAIVSAQIPVAIGAVLSGVRDQADRAMRDEIERVGTERFAAVETALATAITRVEEMGEQIEERAREAVRLETRVAVESALDAAVSAAQAQARSVPGIDLAGAAERAAEIERSLDTAARRFSAETNEQATRVRQQAREAIDQAREECEAAVRQINTGASLRVRKAQQDADRILESLDAQIPPRLQAARARFDEALSEFTAQSQERAAWIKAAISDLSGARVEEVRALLEAAHQQANPETGGTLAESIARAEVLRQHVAANLVQVEELGKQVGLMRDLLARSILEGVQRVDQLDARQEDLLASAARALEEYGRELETLRAAAADRASLQKSETPPIVLHALDPIDMGDAESGEHAHAAIAEAEQRLESLRTQTDEAGRAAEWLAALIDRAANAGIALDESLAAPQPQPPTSTQPSSSDRRAAADSPASDKPARRRRGASAGDPTGDGGAVAR